MCISINICYSTTLLKDQINSKMLAPAFRATVKESTANADQCECCINHADTNIRVVIGDTTL